MLILWGFTKKSDLYEVYKKPIYRGKWPEMGGLQFHSSDFIVFRFNRVFVFLSVKGRYPNAHYGVSHN